MTELVGSVIALFEEQGKVLREALYAYPYMRIKARFFYYPVRSP